MSYQRFARGVRQMGGFAGGTSRLARPPAVLPEPDRKPGGHCWSYFGYGESSNSYTMSPDGTVIYLGPSTDFSVYAFNTAGWTFLYDLSMQDVNGVSAPSGSQFWNFAPFFGASVVHPGSGLMYAYAQVLELDGFGNAVPGGEFQGSLMRFDPSDGSSFDMLYRWDDYDTGVAATVAYLWWHPSAPDTIWIVKRRTSDDPTLDIHAYDISGDTVTTVATDLWPGVTGDLPSFSIFEYDDGFVFVVRSLDGASDDYRICAWDIPTATLATHDFNTSGGSDLADYPAGVDYDGRILYTSTGGAINGYRQISPGSIGSLQPYDDCDIFYAWEFAGYATLFYWFAPADRSVIYQFDGSRIFSKTP